MAMLAWRKCFVAAALALCVSGAILPTKRFDSIIGVYEANRREGVPNYVTQDVYLVAYQDLSRQELQYRERATAEALQRWLGALRVAGSERAGEGPVAAGELLDVLAILGGENIEPGAVAAAELALIEAGEGLTESPLWGAKVDYSQFVPRGRYTEDEASQRYFRQVRYLNSTLFHANASKATGVTEAMVARHMAMLQALITWGGAGEGYTDLLNLAAVTGTIDDLTLADAAAVNNEGMAAGLRELAAKEQRYPAVLQGYVERTALAEGETASQALLGVRLLPGRVTADTLAMQALVNEAGPWTGKGEQPFSAAAGGTGLVKGWPTANEVLVALGVERAAALVSAAGDDAYADYPAAMASAKAAFAERGALATLNWSLARAVAASRDDSVSALTTARALWTLQRHENLLYAKQSYSMVDRSMAPLVDRSQSTIEPVPAVYDALGQLVQARIEQAPAGFADRWQAFATLLASHAALARKAQAQDVLTAEEGDQLADIDFDLKAMGIEADKPVVVDVHTHPGEGQVLQEATAWAIVERSGKARGARLNHREFKQAIAERLTDEAWQAKLREQ